MALIIPLPTTDPETDICEYIGLLISAIEEFLEKRDIWLPEDYETAYDYMQNLKTWLIDHTDCE